MNGSGNRQHPSPHGNRTFGGITDYVSDKSLYNPSLIHVIDVGTHDADGLLRGMRPWLKELSSYEVEELFSDCKLAQFAYIDRKVCGAFAWSHAREDCRERDRWLGNGTAKNHPRVLERIVRMKVFFYRKVSGRAYGGATSVMDAALNCLAEHWRRQTGIMPLLAEADMHEPYRGTCSQAFKATGWFQPRRNRPGSANHPVQVLNKLTPTARKSIRAICTQNKPV